MSPRGTGASTLFEGKNTEYDTVNHPVHGDIMGLIAIEDDKFNRGIESTE